MTHFLFKVKVIPVTTVDPTVERLKMVKQAEEESRAEARREAMRQKMREKQLRKGISAGYLEDQEDDENSFSLNAIKVNIKNTLSRDIEPLFRTVIVTIEHHIVMMQALVMTNPTQIVVVHMLVLLVLNHLTRMIMMKVESALEILHKIQPHQKLKNQNVKSLTILMMMKMTEVKSRILIKILIQIIILIRIRLIKLKLPFFSVTNKAI